MIKIKTNYGLMNLALAKQFKNEKKYLKKPFKILNEKDFDIFLKYENQQ